MPKMPNTPPQKLPPPNVPLDQTRGKVHYPGSGIGLGVVWLWRKVRGFFSTGG